MATERKQTDIKQLEKIISMMKESNLVEIEIVNGEDKIYLRGPEPVSAQANFNPSYPMQAAQFQPQMPAVAPAAAAPEAATANKADEGTSTIPSPIVGTFYAAPSPDSPAFVKVGDTVNADTVVCIVEAMKVMNEIKAEISGTITEVVAKNGQAVEYGQTLFKVKA